MTEIERLKHAIRQVESMPHTALCEKFQRLYGTIACPLNNRTLKNRIIYKLQLMFYGGLSPEDKRILEQIQQNQQKDRANLCPGAKMGKTSHVHYFREWKGKRCDVIEISKKCYEYNGVQYRSLSAVASAITGTHWNGKVFFGVK